MALIAKSGPEPETFLFQVQGSTLRLLNHLPTGQAPLQFDLPECKIYLPDVVFITPNQGGPTFPEMEI